MNASGTDEGLTWKRRGLVDGINNSESYGRYRLSGTTSSIPSIWDAFHEEMNHGKIAYDTTKNEYVLDISKERLKAAPEFDSDHWPAISDERRYLDVYKYYHRPPYRE